MLNKHNYSDFNTNLKALHICQKCRFVDALKKLKICSGFKNKNNNNNDGDNILTDQLNF